MTRPLPCSPLVGTGPRRHPALAVGIPSSARGKALAHRRDRRAGKGVEHRAHQRVRARPRSAVRARAPRLRRRKVGAPSACDTRDDPARAGPFAEQLAEPVGEIARRALGRAELDAARLELHEMDVARQDARASPPRGAGRRARRSRQSSAASARALRPAAPVAAGSASPRSRRSASSTRMSAAQHRRAGEGRGGSRCRRLRVGAADGERADRAALAAGAAPCPAACGPARPGPAGRRHRRGAPAPSPPPAIGDGAVCTSPMPFSSICQARASTGIDELGGERPGALAVAFGHRVAGAGVGRELEPGQEMRELEQILEHQQRIGAALVERGPLRRARRRLAPQHRLEQVEDQAAVGDAEHVAHRRFRRSRSPRQRDRLVEQRQPVAHRAVGGAGDEAERRGLDLDPLGLGDLAVMRGQQSRSARGAAKSAGSATARSPAPSGSRSSRRRS